MRVLSSALRNQLEVTVVAARRAAENASRTALDGLGVFADRRPDHLDAERAALRNGLRAKWRQLGDDPKLLVNECAYEQWHRLLFARFLADNHLLRHPQYGAEVSIDDCEELARELGEPDGWSVAARFAAEILPGIFRVDDPCVRLRLAPEGRQELEEILGGLPADVFVADDSLGWVYQFWQRDKKDEVNASQRKIGGADLGPVTQLFTETYMVRFLLENSLGAWWASRHAGSPLIKDFDYLRVSDDGKPVAGVFENWPDRAAEVTVMDPCCGSGHFLVEAFSMLWRMRLEEEGLNPIEAQDAVLRDNLFGLELDPRCVQIAMCALALHAWKVGGGWRRLPVPNIACSGIPVKAPLREWKALAEGDEQLEAALERLHALFREADTLGSLIDPRRVSDMMAASQLQRSFGEVDWARIAPLLKTATSKESTDPASAVLGADLASLARAADQLDRRYTLICTNPPFLGRPKQVATLCEFSERFHRTGRHDLATTFLDRALQTSITSSFVLPQGWTFLKRSNEFRLELLRTHSLDVVIWLGEGAFDSAAAAGAFCVLAVCSSTAPRVETKTAVLDVRAARGPREKAEALRQYPIAHVPQSQQLNNPEARILPQLISGKTLRSIAETHQGIKTGDNPRLVRCFWEIDSSHPGWRRMQSAPLATAPFKGREQMAYWEDGFGVMASVTQAGATFRGQAAWGSRGVVVAEMRSLYATLYTGELFDGTGTVVVPRRSEDLAMLWAFAKAPEFHVAVRSIDNSLKITSGTVLDVPFEPERWRKVAEEADQLPDPSSDDPTQWLFIGRPEASSAPLQVAVGRLLGYRWPDQADSDDLDALADLDGIVCLPSVSGEPPGVEPLQRLLGTAFGGQWSPTKLKELLEQTGSKKSLADWLRDDFFRQHCTLFGNRPFIWHIWDGQRTGFSALVNYRRLNRKLLEKLTYTYLGQDWVERQRAGVREEVLGADERLAAALELQRRLEVILAGEKPYDIYVRWKALSEQPVGWEPDLNDGVRLNIRPFVEAGILRTDPNIQWSKDRGRNADGSDRRNDLHKSLAEKRAARANVGRP